MSAISEQQFCPYDLLEELEMSSTLADERKLRSFLCACCRQILHKLPEIAQNALVVAEEYNQNLVSKERLVAERIKLWQFWDSTPDHYNNPTLEANAVRAVICCLYEHMQKHEAFDYATNVMDFCNVVEPKEQEQYQLLQEVFND